MANNILKNQLAKERAAAGAEAKAEGRRKRGTYTGPNPTGKNETPIHSLNFYSLCRQSETCQGSSNQQTQTQQELELDRKRILGVPLSPLVTQRVARPSRNSFQEIAELANWVPTEAIATERSPNRSRAILTTQLVEHAPRSSRGEAGASRSLLNSRRLRAIFTNSSPILTSTVLIARR